MKIKHCLFLLLTTALISKTCYSQHKTDILIGKTLTATTGSVCEETPDDNPCAGAMLYTTLQFTTSNTIEITEKEISSCGSVHISSQLKYSWRVKNDTIIVINSKPEDIEYHFLKDLELKFKNDTLFGYKAFNNKIEEYIFNVEE